MAPSFSSTALPRGGTLVQTPIGFIQFGVPPETIKDTMTSESGVPQLFVLSDLLFDFKEGMTLAELEFPAYYHYFFKKQSMTVIATKSQIERVQGILESTLFGPKNLDLAQDFSSHSNWYPPLQKEMDYFRFNPVAGKSMEISDFVNFLAFDEQNQVHYQGLTITALGQNYFQLQSQANNEVFKVKVSLETSLHTAYISASQAIFDPPMFGVTVLGSGHGFAPDAKTSGFLLWLEKQGILVDPPVGIGKWLKKRGVDALQIHSILLTHCHADHDAGTLQICLQAGKIKLYTTPTIYAMFLQKAICLTDVPAEQLFDVVEFCPVFLDQKNHILGGEFVFQYTLHSIPTINFAVSYRGKSFVYSADTLNDPERIQKLYEEGILDQKRYEQLLDFPWESDLIFHEAGVPPLHTPVQILAKLPKQIKDKILLVHTGEPPVDSGLKLAQPGMEKTIRLNVSESRHQEAIEWLLALSRVDYLKSLSIQKAIEFLTNAQKQTFSPGEVLIQKGEKGDFCYFILEGKASILEGEVEEKSYGIGVCLGETALLLDIPRTATVVAKTTLVVLALTRDHFLSLIRGTEIPDFLTKVYQNRQKQSWRLFEQSGILASLEPYQKIHLQGLLEYVEENAGQILQEPNSVLRYAYFLEDGKIEIGNASQKKYELTRGEIFFDLTTPPQETLKTQTSIRGFRVEEREFQQFLKKAPGLLLSLSLIQKTRTDEK